MITNQMINQTWNFTFLHQNSFYLFVYVLFFLYPFYFIFWFRILDYRHLILLNQGFSNIPLFNNNSSVLESLLSFTSKSFLFTQIYPAHKVCVNSQDLPCWMGTILNIFFFLFPVSYLYFTIIGLYNQWWKVTDYM